ncbi:MAG TPA: Xaa-Pro peptidase family protein [Actinomycetota bacterium]|nr:Xaa-Pro peptidase family protein [Actinomycetota bacterium]
MDYQQRRERLVAGLPELGVDAMLVTRLPNVRYLTGYTGSNGQLLVSATGSVFLTDSRYEEQARREVADLRREIYYPEFFSRLEEMVGEIGARRLGFEGAGVSYRTYEKLAALGPVELVPVAEVVERLRWIKDAEELSLIERAQELTDHAYDHATAKLAEGMTEKEVALELEHAMRQSGADGIAFDSIVAFGENAAEPHHRPKERPLATGDVVKLDFGCSVDGYHSDMTRTVAFGEPNPKLREIHEVVFRAQRAGVDALRPGVTGRAADEAARQVIADAGYGDRFGHSLGHGVGLEVHEGPGLRRESTDVVPEGAVVTVEPGVYLPGIGGVRIEDMVVVEAGGARPLPRSPRELVVL